MKRTNNRLVAAGICGAHTMNNRHKKLLSLSLSGLLTIGLLGNLEGAYALSSAAPSTAQLNKLDKHENFLFGHKKEQKDLDERLDAVEKIVFGQTHDGNLGDRIDLIDKMIGKSKDEIVLLPQAPKLDTIADDVAKAPDVVKDNYGFDPAENISKANLQRATALYSQGNLNESEKLFKQVLSAEPNNTDAAYNLGVIAEDKKDYRNALEYYKRAMKSNPGDQDLAEAVRTMSQKIAMAPAPAAAENNSTTEAAPKAQPVAHAPKANLNNLISDAASSYKSGNYQSAIDKLNQVAKEAPQDASVQFALGQAYKAKGETAKAQNHFQKASAIDPSNSTYRTAFLDSSKSEQFASNANSAPQTANAQPAGQLTPFQPVTSGVSRSSYGYGSGFSSLSSGTRIKRAAMGSALGAATGLMLNMRSGNAKKAALTGAIMGGMLGFFSR